MCKLITKTAARRRAPSMAADVSRGAPCTLAGFARRELTKRVDRDAKACKFANAAVATRVADVHIHRCIDLHRINSRPVC